MHSVENQLFAMVPLRQFQWPQDFSYSPADQQQLIDRVFGSSQCKQYPPSISYRMHILKHVMTEAEQRGHDVADELYEVYAALTALPESEFCYKSYNLGEHGYVTIKESSQLISQGTTGLTTWQAAFYFIEWAVENRHLLCHKRILELGSGMGFTGMAVCKTCNPEAYCFTDCHSLVLQKLKENVDINKGSFSASAVVSELDWSTHSEDSQVWGSGDSIDCVIATDVVYDTGLTEAFVKVLVKTLRTHKYSLAYVASTIRNIETYKHFCTCLEAAGIIRTVMGIPRTQMFYYDRSQTIELIELKLQTSTANQHCK